MASKEDRCARAHKYAPADRAEKLRFEPRLAEVPALPDDHPRSQNAARRRPARMHAALFPEQQRANNANLCFNWLEPSDIRRDAGEALSTRKMIGHVVESHGMDSVKIFIIGLPAGGAMANIMLATYPELFAAGAIIGVLPY